MKISFELANNPDPLNNRYMWKPRATKEQAMNVINHLSDKGVLDSAIELNLLPHGDCRLVVQNHVKHLIDWHSCDLEIQVGAKTDGQTPYLITYARTKPKKENCRKA